MGGPSVGFRWGRGDAAEVKKPEEDTRFSPDGRLPDGYSPEWKDMGAQHLRDIFHRMGFDDRGIVALSGDNYDLLHQTIYPRNHIHISVVVFM